MGAGDHLARLALNIVTPSGIGNPDCCVANSNRHVAYCVERKVSIVIRSVAVDFLFNPPALDGQ
jgi:hypothetical protein